MPTTDIPLEQTVLDDFMRMKNSFFSIGRSMHPKDLSHSEFVMLFRIHESIKHINAARVKKGELPLPGMQVSQLSKKMNCTASSVSQTISKLEKYGWVRREPGQNDRRSVYVSLTEEGLRLITSHPQPLVDCIALALKEMSPEKAAQFSALLSEFSENVAQISRAITGGNS